MILQDKLKIHQTKFLKSLVGTIQEILIEKYGKFSKQYIGRSPYMNPVVITSKDKMIGRMIKVKITDTTGLSLSGHPVT